MRCRIVWNVSHLKLHYCSRHPIYAVYIDQRLLYALSLHLRAVCCILFARLCVCVCSCVYIYDHVFLHMCLDACMHACMHVGCNTKSSSVPVDTKPDPPSPSSSSLGGVEIRQSVYLPAPSRREAGALDGRL